MWMISMVWFVCLGAAQAAPTTSGFSGSWVLDPARSVLHPSGIRNLELQVTDRQTSITVVAQSGGSQEKYTCTTDGKVSEEVAAAGSVYARSVHRDKDGLAWLVRMTRGADKATIEFTERWSLSDAGQTLRVYRVYPGGREVAQVFTRKAR